MTSVWLHNGICTVCNDIVTAVGLLYALFEALKPGQFISSNSSFILAVTCFSLEGSTLCSSDLKATSSGLKSLEHNSDFYKLMEPLPSPRPRRKMDYVERNYFDFKPSSFFYVATTGWPQNGCALVVLWLSYGITDGHIVSVVWLH